MFSNGKIECNYQNKLMNDGKDKQRHNQHCGAGYRYFLIGSEWNPASSGWLSAQLFLIVITH